MNLVFAYCSNMATCQFIKSWFVQKLMIRKNGCVGHQQSECPVDRKEGARPKLKAEQHLVVFRRNRAEKYLRCSETYLAAPSYSRQLLREYSLN